MGEFTAPPGHGDQERRALQLSIAGTFAMAVIGIGFALLSGSEAIMLDGIFDVVFTSDPAVAG